MKALIVALNSKYIHKALAPWCLKAYCESKNMTDINVLEMTVNDNINTILENIIKFKADILCFSCYIWNIEFVIKLCESLKIINSKAGIILGGPEVLDAKENSYPYADIIIKGEGEIAFYETLKNFHNDNDFNKQLNRVITAKTSDFANFPSPFNLDYFNSFDEVAREIENKLIYYESSRGCPFDCSYCLSGASQLVYYLPIDRVKNEILMLLNKGAKVIKFVDRTFNANKKRACEILEFVKSLDTDATFHFEVAADLFDEKTLQLISEMPVKRVQFESGIQSTNETTLKEVCRKTDIKKSLDNCRYILKGKNAHLHIDLIAGLPYENIDSFKKSFNDCIAIRPHMLQLGFLKMLKGSAIRNNSAKYNYKYAAFAPYEVFENDCFSLDDLFALKNVEAILDKFYNSGMFYKTVDYALSNTFKECNYSFFENFALYCEQNGGIKRSSKQCYKLLYDFMLSYDKRELIEYLIKTDALAYDPKAQMPDEILQERDKKLELKLAKQMNLNHKNLRVEHFEYNKITELFIYDTKDKITNLYKTVRVTMEGE